MLPEYLLGKAVGTELQLAFTTLMKSSKGAGKADERLIHFGKPVAWFLLNSNFDPYKGMTCAFQIFGGSLNF